MATKFNFDPSRRAPASAWGDARKASNHAQDQKTARQRRAAAAASHAQDQETARHRRTIDAQSHAEDERTRRYNRYMQSADIATATGLLEGYRTAESDDLREAYRFAQRVNESDNNRNLGIAITAGSVVVGGILAVVVGCGPISNSHEERMDRQTTYRDNTDGMDDAVRKAIEEGTPLTYTTDNEGNTSLVITPEEQGKK